jgi:23S rRNA pseudouridine1911/1915/1917 synthase
MLTVLYEDNHCLALAKPARMLTVGDQTGDDSLLELAKAYLKEKYAKPGNVFVGVVHRLDRPVSGVVLFARTSKAAARLSEQFRLGTVEKVYTAIVEGSFEQPAGELVDWLKKETQQNIVRCVKPGTPEARQATLAYRQLDRRGHLTLLELRPKTGRSHQIRVQLAARGCPILGDVKYGSHRRLAGTIALHAASLTFEHPVTHQRLTVSAEPPASWSLLLGVRSPK